MHRLAIYDMDKTITRHATFIPLLLHVIRKRAWARALLMPVTGLVTLAFVLKLIGRGRIKEINLALIAGRRFDAKSLGEAFAAQTIANNLLPKALAQIAADKADGRQLIMASASYAFYVEPVMRSLGFDVAIATRSNPAFPATILGENCYGAAKRAMVEQWLAEQGIARELAHIRFYSDHVSDAPMFELADEAVAVNAHPPLAKLARERGWQVLDWRN